MLLQWLSGYLIIKKVNSGEAEVSRFTALVTGVTGALTTFTMVWAIYGLVVFFNLPACPQGEAHNFGKILAVAGIVVFSLVVCCLLFFGWYLSIRNHYKFTSFWVAVFTSLELDGV